MSHPSDERLQFLWREVSLNTGVGKMGRSGTVGGRDSIGRTRERGGRGEREVNIQDAGHSMWLPTAVLGPSPLLGR